MERSTCIRLSRRMESINDYERTTNRCAHFVHAYKKQTLSGWQRSEIYEYTGIIQTITSSKFCEYFCFSSFALLSFCFKNLTQF